MCFHVIPSLLDESTYAIGLSAGRMREKSVRESEVAPAYYNVAYVHLSSMTYIGIRALPVTFGEHAAKRFEHEQETFYHASTLKVERSLCDYK